MLGRVPKLEFLDFRYNRRFIIQGYNLKSLNAILGIPGDFFYVTSYLNFSIILSFSALNSKLMIEHRTAQRNRLFQTILFSFVKWGYEMDQYGVECKD